ncbi:MAG: M24 family metallopeptidase [Chloroflexota bacterium]|nr:MAG: M24 family metallopeptidase [Chloroflexota bacterium]
MALAEGVATRVAAARDAIAIAGIDGWLLYDFQGKNPIFWQLLGEPRHTTRRCYLLVPRAGEPRMLCHAIDVTALSPSGIPMTTYITWQDLSAALPLFLRDRRRLAMDYSPGSMLPVVSRVDGGTLDLVRALGIEVVSSADLIQAAVARWSAGDLADHLSAAEKLHASLRESFRYIAERVNEGITEFGVARFLRDEFSRRGVTTEDGPIVAVNAHSGDPHYEPSATDDTPIRIGDWLLIDLWARESRPGTVYADSTWVAVIGRDPTKRELKVFDAVRRARDAAVERIRSGWRAGEPVAGWQVDRAARDVIAAAGYGAHFTHRTGHSLGQQVHGPGVNLDDFETHDTRALIQGIAVTVEPGIYLPEFGARSEINVVMTAQGPRVTLPEQLEVTRIA